ncbi:MAG: nucleotidyltransferase substrate binding protein (TIGR01987 family) [Phenylobacterium sp.]|jgi:nucleotidyltransferase substrate binding protein (TIGR01987 family)
MLDFSSLNHAIGSLTESIEVIDRYLTNGGTVTEPEFRTFRAGVIQNFEFTYELSWKAMRVWLGENVGKTLIDGISRKELFRFAAEHYLIDDINSWFDYHRQRNQTSHTYEEKTAVEVYHCVRDFLADAQLLSTRLAEKND